MGEGVKKAATGWAACARVSEPELEAVGMASSWRREQSNKKLVSCRGRDQINRHIKSNGSQLSPYLRYNAARRGPESPLWRWGGNGHVDIHSGL